MKNPLVTPLATLLAASAGLAHAGSASLPDPPRVVLPGTVNPRLASLRPLGAVPSATPLARMNLVLTLDAAAQARLDATLRRQQDPASPDYHKWLTPEGFRANFAPSQAQVDAAVRWLLQEGFTVHGVARSGMSIAFSGTAAQVGTAFRTSIQEFEVDGARHRGNVTPVSIPAELAGFVGGVTTLHDLRRSAYHRRSGLAGPQITDARGNHYLGPQDLATIYDLTPLHQAGTTGTGVTVGIVGRTDLPAADLGTFMEAFGVARTGSYRQVVNGADPGTLNLDEQFEAEADTQWSAAAAPGADILFVASPSSVGSDGVDLSAQYLVDNNLADVISCSFGSCEALMGSSELAFYQTLWAQAAAQGITVFVSAGDNGPAGCDNPDQFTATQGKGVSGLASPPTATAVGGTQFNDGAGTYWAAAGASTPYAATALGYIPEIPWNQSGTVAGGDRLWAGSGGASTVYAKPSWQDALNVPADGKRDLPDVALAAAGYGNDPYLVYLQGNYWFGGGTSLASPCMAGIMALVVQRHGRQGNANPTLYSLGRAQYAGTGAPAVFHDVTTGTTTVPGVAGYAAQAGFDLATGLGSVDAAVLVGNWSGTNPITLTSVTAGASSAPAGQPITFTGAATDSLPGTLTYTWYFGDGSHASGPSVSHAFTPAARLPQPASVPFTATLAVSDGTWTQARSVTVQVTPTGVYPAILAPVGNVWVIPGTTIAFGASAQSFNAGASAAFTYAWDFGDGGSATGASVSHAFAAYDSDFRTVTVTARDSTGVQGSAQIKVYASYYCMDQNGDGAIDVRDLLALSATWGGAAVSATSLGGLDLFGDLNADGKVDDADLALWTANFTPGAP